MLSFPLLIPYLQTKKTNPEMQRMIFILNYTLKRIKKKTKIITLLDDLLMRL